MRKYEPERPPRIREKVKKPVDQAALARRREWVNYGYVRKNWQTNAKLGK